MAAWQPGASEALHQHVHPKGRRTCLYETIIRQAIASQHGLRDADRSEFRACDGCGKPFLLQPVWLPFAEEGELACPRCGTLAVSWEGTQGYVAYWQREAERRVLSPEC